VKALTELEVQKAAILKAARTAIRLKHSLAADAELADKLPKLEDRINRALAAGQPLEITLGSVLDEA